MRYESSRSKRPRGWQGGLRGDVDDGEEDEGRGRGISVIAGRKFPDVDKVRPTTAGRAEGLRLGCDGNRAGGKVDRAIDGRIGRGLVTDGRVEVGRVAR